MKRLLLGTTALAVASLAATEVFAAEKIKLGLGGYFDAYFAVANLDSASGIREHGIGRESEIFFTGSTTLNNGLTVGANIQLEGETSGDQIDESYIFFSGGFGELRLGSDDDAAEGFWMGAPGVVSGFGVNDPNIVPPIAAAGGNAISANNSEPTISGDSDKLKYISPNFRGLGFTVSYAPDATEESGSALRSDNDAGQQGEIVSVAARYKGKASGVSFGVYGGFTHGTLEIAGGNVTDDRSVWGAGAMIGFSGATLAASYKDDDQGNASGNRDRTDWNVGAAYAQGAWAASLAYGHTEVEQGAGAGEDTLDVGELGLTYTLGPGIALTATASYWDWEDNAGAAADEAEASVLTLGTAIKF